MSEALHERDVGLAFGCQRGRRPPATNSSGTSCCAVYREGRKLEIEEKGFCLFCLPFTVWEDLGCVNLGLYWFSVDRGEYKSPACPGWQCGCHTWAPSPASFDGDSVQPHLGLGVSSMGRLWWSHWVRIADVHACRGFARHLALWGVGGLIFTFRWESWDKMMSLAVFRTRVIIENWWTLLAEFNRCSSEMVLFLHDDFRVQSTKSVLPKKRCAMCSSLLYTALKSSTTGCCGNTLSSYPWYICNMVFTLKRPIGGSCLCARGNAWLVLPFTFRLC